AADAEILQAALGLRAPIMRRGHLNGAHGVGFGAGGAHAYCVLSRRISACPMSRSTEALPHFSNCASALSRYDGLGPLLTYPSAVICGASLDCARPRTANVALQII